jgi:hypothetical protein
VIINKITTGFVIQRFDTDLQKFVSQEFIASEAEEYETENETQIDYKDFLSLLKVKEPYLHFDMEQP